MATKKTIDELYDEAIEEMEEIEALANSDQMDESDTYWEEYQKKQMSA